ncbi:MAG: HD domain-containing protein [Thermodesulfobacteriota bacterium]|nr:HD domain-containing protein [Thermodesulfobacteriota bacterium]
MSYQRDLLILASLLHDIGKFAQRAGRPQNKAAEETYCPLNNKFKRHTHKHVLYTDHFIEHDMPLPPALERDRGRLARLAAAHHKPDQDNLMEMCISTADCLSSGAERIEGVPDEEESYLKARLVSIFDQIFLDKHKVDPKDPKWFYKLLPIDGDPYPCGKERRNERTMSYFSTYSCKS